MNTEEFADRVFRSALGAIEILSIHLGTAWAGTARWPHGAPPPPRS
nr:hypothetical protein GCM10020093_024480 [Planobispora longispora]